MVFQLKTAYVIYSFIYMKYFDGYIKAYCPDNSSIYHTNTYYERKQPGNYPLVLKRAHITCKKIRRVKLLPSVKKST